MKFAVHPGLVRSATDNDWHYVSAARLITLYQLRPEEYIVWDHSRPETYQGRREVDYKHLYPRFNGDYGRPEAAE